MNQPIQNQHELMGAVIFIASETSRMARKIIGKTFPIKSLTIFAHSESEFASLSTILAKMGKSYDYNNGPRVELYSPIKIGENNITYLRVRKPDSKRPQAGCNDFETNYKNFKSDYLLKYKDNLSLIKRPEYEMIEFHDQEFDALAYVVSN